MRLIGIFTALIFQWAALAAAAPASGLGAGEVSVRLRPLKGTISVAGTNLKVLSNNSSQGRPLLERTGFERLSFHFQIQGPTRTWIVSDPADDRVLASINGEKAEIRGDDLRIDLRPAPNRIQLVARKRRLDLVGILSIEEYLEGVVASEVPSDWPMEALKAQAVAARSFTVAKIRDRANSNPDWLLESNVTDQVFDFERGHARSTEAVRATKGEVLARDQGEVVAANYHSDCGGRTDEARTIWGGGVSTGTAIDKSCSTKRSPWRFVRSLEDLTASLAGHGLLPAGFKLASIAISGRSSGGRALSLRVESTVGRSRLIPGERLRAALGYSELKSTLFDVKPVSSATVPQVEFVGRGFGHGTGLCQWGARELALSGKSHREILKHYYPLLKLAQESTR